MSSGTTRAIPTGFELELIRARVPLLAALRRRGLAFERAEELVQEAAVRALAAKDRFDRSRPLLPWLLVIALRVHLDETRRGPVPASAVESGGDPVTVAIQREEGRRVAAALGHLAESQRRVLALFYQEGRSVTEIAARLGLKAGTVKSHLHRARAELARRLAEERTT